MLIRTTLWLLASLVTTPLLAAEPVLRIYNWMDYMDAGLIRAFEQQNQVKIEQLFFEDEADRDANFKQIKPDLVMLSSDFIERYISKDWIIPLDESQLDNLAHVERNWLRRYDRKLYAMPYVWGSLGIAYRRDLLGANVTYWKDIFNLHDEPLKQRLYMLSGANEVVGIALKALDYNQSTTAANVLQTIETMLLQQKPYVKAYAVPDLDATHPLVTGEAWISMMYSGDALVLEKLNPHITYVTPEEGTLLWLDQFAISVDSRNQALALRFLNFLQTPENAAQTALSLFYATPNHSAKSLLPAAHLNNHTIYPPLSVMMKSEFLQTNNDSYQAIFKKVLP